MSRRIASAAVAVALVAAGCGKNFGIAIDVEKGCLQNPVKGTVTVEIDPGARTSNTIITNPGDFFSVNHRIVVVPPDGATQITVTVVATDASGATATGNVTIAIDGHQVEQATLTLAQCSAPPPVEMGMGEDMAAPDLATDDLASEDLAGGDLVMAGAGDAAGPLDQGVDARPDLVTVQDATQLADLAPGPDLAGCTDQSCAAPLLCNHPTGRCVQCNGDAQCAPGTICSPNLTCIPGCNVGHDCAKGQCDLVNSVCVDCNGDPDCGGQTPRCDPMLHTCVACLPGGPECNGTCEKVGGVWQCFAKCNVDGDCKLAGQHCCNSACIDTTADVNNCGGCGAKCVVPNGTPLCANSVCQVGSCDKGFVDCNQKVADGCEANVSSDPNNCGRCFDACPANAPVCTDGVCFPVVNSCPQPSQLQCNGVCTEVLSNVKDCGGCGLACMPYANSTATCAMGLCSYPCTPPWTSCVGEANGPCMINTDNDPGNCGGCGHVCAPGQMCIFGVCGTSDDGLSPRDFSMGPHDMMVPLDLSMARPMDMAIPPLGDMAHPLADFSFIVSYDIAGADLTFPPPPDGAMLDMPPPGDFSYLNVDGPCLVPQACHDGTDPESGSPYTVCISNCKGGWLAHVGANGTYHPTQICKALGWSLGAVFVIDDCGNTCGNCNATGSCMMNVAPPNTFAQPAGMDANGLYYTGDIAWICSN